MALDFEECNLSQKAKIAYAEVANAMPESKDNDPVPYVFCGVEDKRRHTSEITGHITFYRLDGLQSNGTSMPG